MRPEVRHILMKRMKNDYANDADYADMSRRDMNKHMEYDEAYQDGYDTGYEDGRRGVKGSGRSRDRMDRHFSEEDDEDYDKTLRLPRKVRMQWLHNLKDKDGRKGPRFTKDEVMDVADKMRIDYDDYTPADLYLMTNVLYSDLTTFKPLIPKDKEIYYWVDAAKEWLEDDDSGLVGSNKVVSYYYNVVRG